MVDIHKERRTAREGALLSVIVIIVNIATGIGIPLIVRFFTPMALSGFESVLLGLLIIISLSLFEAIFALASIKSIRLSEYEIWSNRLNIDRMLENVRTSLHKIVVDDELRDSFFLDHYTRELALLDDRLQTTITRKQMLLDRFHIESTEVLLSLYDRSEHTEFLATHVLADITELFDVTYQFYFDAWLKRLKSQKVKSLRRLFILDDSEELGRPNVRKLLAFHNNEIRGLQAKIIPKSEVLRVKSDFYINDGVLDFGIFSNAYIYLGSTRKDDQIAGYFSRDSKAIQKYSSAFNTIWNSSSAKPVSDYIQATITPEQLFERSSTLEKPTNHG